MGLIRGMVTTAASLSNPSSDPEPSACDMEITRTLVAACQVVDIRFLDHVILGNGGFFSFADKGLIEDYKYRAQGLLR